MEVMEVTVDDDLLADRFEDHRAHLRAVAYRMLGSTTEADDAVQESWLRLSRSETSAVQNLGGWLTTVVARVCLDMLRARASRREDPIETVAGGGVADGLGARIAGTPAGPEDEAELADSVGVALLAVLDTLSPAERLAFVLHDMFAVPFSEIGPITGRSPDAAKMLASRARRRVQQSERTPGADPVRQRALVAAFLAASREGDFEGLLGLLDPDVILKADPAAARMGATGDLRGAAAVAGNFSGRAAGAELALVDGAAAAVWSPSGRLRMVFRFVFAGERISEIGMVADRDRLREMDVEILGPA
jgi:RNA polymerase sigma-70 factor (ECF subfamily)